MKSDKSLQLTSVISNTYKNENNADELMFLLPLSFDDIDLKEYTINAH